MKSNIKCSLLFLITVFAAFHLFRQLRPIKVAHAQATESGTPDTTPPTAPSSLAANVSGTFPSQQTNLSWTASTDNVGVTAYYVERCLGSGCSTFVQVGVANPKSYSSNFPLTENPISEGSTWSNGGVATGGTFKNVQTNGTIAYGSQVQVNPDFADNLAIRADSWRPDVTIIGNVVVNTSSGSNGYELELLGHMSFSAGNRTGYEFNVNMKPATGNYWGLVRLEGAPGSFTSLATGTFGGGHTTGDTMKMVFSGSSISVYYNNSLLSTVTDSTYATGKPGIGFDPYNIGSGNPGLTDVGFSSWQATEAGNTFTDTNLQASTSYSYRVRATDAAGNLSSYSSIVSATTAPAPPPTVSITAPLAGAPVSGSSVTLTATASATSPATISSVQFQVDGVNIGAPVTGSSPYTTHWNSTTVANGNHSLIAVATDSNNTQTLSTPVNVTVNNSSSVPTLTSVSPGSGVQGGAVPVTLTGTNFVTGATVAVSGTGLTVGNVSVVNSTSITATFTIAANAPLGADNVTVTTSGGTSNTQTFTVSLPAPTLTSVSPNAGVQGNAVPVTLTGTDFLSGATVAISGTGVTVGNVSLVNSTSITATFTIAANATLGADNVTVTTSSGTSNAQAFTVSLPAPTLTSVSPNAGVQGNVVPVTLTGTNFLSGATVAVSGTGVTVGNVSVASSTSITATFTIAANATLGAGNVTLTTSSGTSNAQAFTVSATAPTLTSVSPNAGVQGNVVPVTLTGTNFLSGATVAVSGTGVTVGNVTVVNSTSITATFTIAANATLGADNVTVSTSSGTSNAQTFTVSAPNVPAITSVSPNSGVQGNVVPVTLTGTNFTGGATIAVSGTGVTVGNISVVSSTSMNATFTIAANAALGADNVTVTTSIGTSAPQVFTVVAPQVSSPTLFNIPTNGGVSLVTSNPFNSSTTVLHAQVSSGGSSATTASAMASAAATSPVNPGLAGVAIIGMRTGAGLISETGVPASRLITAGRIYIETQGPVNTGLALSNSGTLDAVISFYFTDQNGTDYGFSSFALPANHEIAAFLNQPPFNGPANSQGTLTFSSTVPVSAIALRGLTNERSEFLMSTLPVAEFGVVQNSSVIPQFADGGGWVSQIILVNSSDVLETGAVQFVGQGSSGQSGQPLNMTVNGVSGWTFNYSISPHGMLRLATAGTNAGIQAGSVQINVTEANLFATPVPVAFAILSMRSGGVTVSEASIPGSSISSSFHVYLESSGSFGAIGSIDSGVAIANPSASPATVLLTLTGLDGTPLGSPVSINVPAGGQVARFISELFQGLPTSFQGIGQLTTTSNIAVAALRGRYNERGDFLMTTTAPANDMVSGTSTIAFPHIVSGLGFGTQIVMFGQPGSGSISLSDQSGNAETGPVLVPGP